MSYFNNELLREEQFKADLLEARKVLDLKKQDEIYINSNDDNTVTIIFRDNMYPFIITILLGKDGIIYFRQHMYDKSQSCYFITDYEGNKVPKKLPTTLTLLSWDKI